MGRRLERGAGRAAPELEPRELVVDTLGEIHRMLQVAREQQTDAADALLALAETVAAMAGDEFKLKEVLILATVLAIGSYLAFIVLLKLQFQVWPTFITG